MILNADLNVVCEWLQTSDSKMLLQNNGHIGYNCLTKQYFYLYESLQIKFSEQYPEKNKLGVFVPVGHVIGMRRTNARYNSYHSIN